MLRFSAVIARAEDGLLLVRQLQLIDERGVGVSIRFGERRGACVIDAKRFEL